MAPNPFAALQEEDEEPKPADRAKLCSSCGASKPIEVCRMPRADTTVRETWSDTRTRLGSQAFSKRQWGANARLRRCAQCAVSPAAALGGGEPEHAADGVPPQGANKDAPDAEQARASSASCCWICYDDDPALGVLVAPCKCRGTVAYGRHYVVLHGMCSETGACAPFATHTIAVATHTIAVATGVLLTCEYLAHGSAQRLPGAMAQSETVVGARVLHLPRALQSQQRENDNGGHAEARLHDVNAGRDANRRGLHGVGEAQAGRVACRKVQLEQRRHFT